MRRRYARTARCPPRGAASLLTEAGETLDGLETLIRRINRTNAMTVIDGGGTLTDALARRDVLRLRHAVITSAADAAAGAGTGISTIRATRRFCRGS
ncbi:hypothetical protein RNC47_22005 [Streptomyces sp. DSM 44918]|uniref:Bacterial bifunctional deaminase-reductase C-terminal domain-containing protein n=1 Tax=Streptomyces millisiae TaxID=3075542 RepID=A0ABU2LTT0_9ACTN|nr:hypothetical protein [Streptomyces sp. DSM 44918]MDT0321011.1 hypothetical protein [Streptomyces sp. DSM 44918]